MPQPATDAMFQPGQVWGYHTRPGEEGSTVTILRVETLPRLGVIVHVRIEGVQFKNCTGGPAPRLIAHAPFAREALAASLTQKVGRRMQLPAYQEGYEDWLRACGGVYTISVAKVVAVDEATFSAGLGCPV